MKTSKLINYLIIIALLLKCSSSFSQARKDQVIRDNFQKKLNEIQTSKNMPGITAAFVLPNGETMKFAAGLSDTSNQILMKPEDRLMSGSVGKTFVAAIIAKFVEEGLLSYDDPIKKWFADLDFYDKIPNRESITVRMLLSHRTGWVQHFFESTKFQTELFQILGSNPDKQFTPYEIFHFVTYDDDLFEADTKFHYSDMNYIALGVIIEKISGESYYQVLQEKILIPFGLNSTIPANSRQLEGLVNGYINPKDPVAAMSPTAMQNGALIFNPSIEWTGGGLATNSGDLAQWARILWKPDWLKHKSMKKLTTLYGSEPQIGVEGYGFGTEIWQTELGVLYGHSGYYTGYNTIMGYFPDKKIAVALQINRDCDNGDLKTMLVELAKVIVKN